MAMSHVKLTAETRLEMPQKHEIYGYFFKQFFESFPGKYVKNIIQEMKRGLSLRQQQVQVITIYYIRSLADKTNASRKKPTILLFF